MNMPRIAATPRIDHARSQRSERVPAKPSKPRSLPAYFAFAFVAVLVLVLHGRASAQACDPRWLPGQGLLGTSGQVYAAESWDPDGPGAQSPRFVLGGAFSAAGNRLAGGVVLLDPVTREYESLGSGFQGTVRAIATLANGDLAVGGIAFSINGQPASAVARWNGTSWSSIGSMVFQNVYAMVSLPNGDLVIGGSFRTVGGIAFNGLARWDGSTWQLVGSGLDLNVGGEVGVNALRAVPGGEIVVGGRFRVSTGTSFANNIAAWNGSTWRALGSGASNTVYSLATLASGDLIAGGESSGWLSVARWNGSVWSALGGGVPGVSTTLSYVRTLAILPNGNLLAAGSFTTTGGASNNRVAVWNGTAWSWMGGLVNSTVNVLSAMSDTTVAMGGSMTSVGGAPVSRVALWNGSDWTAAGTGGNGAVTCMAKHPDGSLIVGGAFAQFGGVLTNGMARRNRGVWSALGTGLTGTPNAIAVLADGSIVAGGNIVSAGGTAVTSVARWDGTSWSAMGAGLSGTVQALLPTPEGGVIAGGSFTRSGATPLGSLATWNGTAWLPFAGGVQGGVNALLRAANGDILAAGQFSGAGTLSTSNVARWNGTSWMSLGAGLPFLDFSQAAYALAQLPNGDFLVGGDFTVVSPVLMRRVARWNGVAWSAVGNPQYDDGSGGRVRAILPLSDGGIVAGGELRYLNFNPQGYIAVHRGTTWSSIGTGTDADVQALLPIGVRGVLAGGRFVQAGGVVSAYLASWDSPCQCPADLDDGTGTGTPDGGVTIDDLLYYITLYADGVARADVDDGSSTGTPDGGVTIDDLLYYLLRFEGGC